jgi:Domain of unknown function DUF11/RTX calcium-binding nonapeptide repeat (4 copies)
MVLAAGIATPAHAGGPVRCNGEVATIVGSNRPDVLRGTDGDDVIAALGGRDVVFGLGGDDVLCGGKGRDVLLGNGGTDLLLGNGGRDVAIGGRGDDNCRAEVARCEDEGDDSSAIDLELQLQADRFDSPSIFNEAVYTVINRGALRTGNVVVTDTLPAGITLQSVSSPNDVWDCSVILPAPTPGRETLSCRYSQNLVPDEISFTLTLAVDVATPTTVTNTACITMPVDANPDNDCSTVQTPVVTTPPPP